MSPKDSPHSPSAMANQQYCLKWNNHQSNLLRAFDRLLQSESFTDVTLACDGRSMRAHKVVLSACSSYFEQLFEEHPDKSPIIILKDMKFTHVSQLVNFMYRGEINITQDQLSGLLKTAETLKVKGLAEVSGEAGMAAGMAAAGATQPMPIASTPQLMPKSSSPLTTALNAPSMPSMSPMTAMSPMTSMSTMPSMSSPLTGPPLAPLAALLHNPGAMQHAFDERRVNLLKRMAGSDPDLSPSGTPDITTPKSIDRPSTTHFLSQMNQDRSMAFTPKMQRTDDGGSPKMPPGLFMSTDPSKQSPLQNVLTPIPHEVTVNAQQELPDFLKPYTVFRLNDYLGFRTRQQFWEEPAVRRILEGIKNKEIDMKSAAELLGVSYGTLYGRYREVFGYLKHSWVNKPGRTPGQTNKERSIWEEARAQELIQRVLNKELSLTAAAVRLGVDTNTFFTHITDNGKNKALVALLLGKDNNKENAQRMILPHNIFMDSMGVETIGIDCEPEHPALMSEDSNNGISNLGSPAAENSLHSLHSLHSNENQNMMVTIEGQESADHSQHGEMNGERDPLDVECSVGIIEEDGENVEAMDHGTSITQETESIERLEENGDQQLPPMETLQQETQIETLQQEPHVENLQQQSQLESLQQEPHMETSQQTPPMDSLQQQPQMEALLQPRPMESLLQPRSMESLLQPRPMESLLQPRAMETLLQQPSIETMQQQPSIESFQQPPQMENFQMQPQIETFQPPPMETFQAMVDSDPVGIHAES